MSPENNAVPRLVLVDGSSYLYRAYHALPPLTNSKGQATGAVFGVVNMLRTLLKDYAPDYIAVVFDAKGRTFRDDLYEHYKANRPPMPDDLRSQIEPLHAVVRALGLPCLVVDGVEADDVIGTLAVQARTAGMDVVISTGDKDIAQLVDEHVTLINTMTRQSLDAAGVVEKFSVPPARIVDYLALIGDTSDNIPGVPGVGPKTAVALLKEHDSLAGIIAHADSIKGKTGERIRAHLDQLPLSQRLATIKCDVKLDGDVRDLRRAAPDTAVLSDLYRHLEFKRLLEELPPADGALAPAPTAVAAPASDPPAQYDCVLTAEAFAGWLDRLRRAELIAFDTETTSLDTLEAEIVGVSFAVNAGEAAYVPLAHEYPDVPVQLARDEVLAQLKPLLEDPRRPKVGQNLKYDLAVLARYGIRCAGLRFDTMLESYVLNSTLARHDMDSLALAYLGYKTLLYEEVAGKGAAQIPFGAVDTALATRYAAEDADITLRLHQALWPQLASTGRLRQVFETIEMPLVPVLARMERHGVLIDAGMLHRQSEELGGRMQELEQQIYTLAGSEFNLGSPKQIQEILFDRMGLPVIEKTPKGQPSTAESTLQELAVDYPLPGLILEHRALSKLKSTYTDRLPEQISPHTGRLHTSYHQAVAATGRLSSSNPNLQNIPIRTEFGRRIRQAFVAPPGHRLLAADYSQIELRILAHLSQDAGLLAAFTKGVDIHRATAAEIFGLDLHDVTTDQRRSAKAINFGLIYGMSSFGLARQLGIDRNAAQEYMDLYFSRYPGVKRLMDETRRSAGELGYVETLFGRRLYLPEIQSRNRQRREYAERAAINAPMQGTAADIIKRAMLKVDGWLEQDGGAIKMIMQVHDELVFEVPTSRVDEALTRISAAMSSAAELAVPLEVGIGVGLNWDEAH
ncbi:MAG: DNA polymerase I [Gammaproteobacteria bacterium]|nr:DNA polymerase I [Gammaproteobacteria bacterium]